jgi:AcrR family transcriptional regulator
MANEELKRQNLQRALEAAYQCFLEYGIEKTTQNMIARRSGVSLRSVSRYFTDKVDLAVQVAQYVGRKMSGASQVDPKELEKSGKTGIELLKDYMERLKEQALEHPEGYALRQEYMLFILRNHLPYEKYKARLEMSFGGRPVLGEIFRIGRADGTIKTPNTDQEEIEYFLQAYIGIVTDQAVRYWAGGSVDERRAFIDEYIDRIVNRYPRSRYD